MDLITFLDRQSSDYCFAICSLLSFQGACAAFRPFNSVLTSMYIRLSIYFCHFSCYNAISKYHSLFCLSNSISLRLPCTPGMFQDCSFHWCGHAFITFVSVTYLKMRTQQCAKWSSSLFTFTAVVHCCVHYSISFFFLSFSTGYNRFIAGIIRGNLLVRSCNSNADYKTKVRNSQTGYRQTEHEFTILYTVMCSYCYSPRWP